MAASRTLMALAVAAVMVVQFAMAANYTVGDTDGWELGTDFASWAASKKFIVGDVLNFEYSLNHDVLEVTEPNFGICESTNPIEMHTGGSTAVTLSAPGKRYFICGVAGHCGAGMKVEINTLAASSPPPPSTETPPTPPPEVTPSSPPPTSPDAPSSPPASPPPTSPDTPSSPPASPPPTSPETPSSPPASPPKAATKPPAKSPPAPPPGSDASPPTPPTGPSSPPPEPDSPISPFPFGKPSNPTGAPTSPAKPPPPPSSAYKCSLGVHLSMGFSFVVIMFLAL